MKLSDFFERLVDEDVNVGFRAYDGSVAGPAGAETVVEVRSPLALRYLLTSPGELGLARAYVTGALEIHGDLHAALTGLLAHRRIDVRAARRAARGARPGALGTAPAADSGGGSSAALAAQHAPAHARARRGGDRTPLRPLEPLLRASARAHHDLLVRGLRQADSTLDEAQVEKVDLICRKLDLRPGQRLLDVGAGWGALIRHAAEHYGVSALGVTLSEQQVAVGATGNRRGGPGRPGGDPPPRLPRRARDGLRRDLLGGHDGAHRKRRARAPTSPS